MTTHRSWHYPLDSVVAMVDECDSTVGCDAYHDYQPPRLNNVVDDSKAVWEALVCPRTTEVA